MLLYTFIGCILLLIQLPLGWTAGYLLKTIGFAFCMAGMRELTQHFYSLKHKSNHDDPPVRVSGLGGIAVWRTVKKRLDIENSFDEKTESIEGRTVVTITVIDDPLKARADLTDMLGKNAVLCGAAGLISAGAAAIFEFLVGESGAVSPAANLTAIALGIINTLTSLRLVYGIIAFLEHGDHSGREWKDVYKDKLILSDNFTDVLRLKSAFEKTAICALVNLGCDVLNRAVPVETIQTYMGFLAAISKLTLYVFVIITAIKFNDVRNGVDRKN